MVQSKQTLLKLASSVADRKAIDWDAAQEKVSGADRPIARALRLVATIASAGDESIRVPPSEHRDAPAFIGLLGLSPTDVSDLLQLVREGFPERCLEQFSLETGIPSHQWSQSLDLGSPEMMSGSARLSRDHSERLLRAARVFDSAIRLFDGRVERAREWLNSPQAGVGGGTPMNLLRSEAGAREVENLIGRLADGSPV